MDDELEIERLGTALRATREQAKVLDKQLHEALVRGFNNGLSTTTLTQRSGLARELVRRTLKEADEQGRLTRPRPGVDRVAKKPSS